MQVLRRFLFIASMISAVFALAALFARLVYANYVILAVIEAILVISSVITVVVGLD